MFIISQTKYCETLSLKISVLFPIWLRLSWTVHCLRNDKNILDMDRAEAYTGCVRNPSRIQCGLLPPATAPYLLVHTVVHVIVSC